MDFELILSWVDMFKCNCLSIVISYKKRREISWSVLCFVFLCTINDGVLAAPPPPPPMRKLHPQHSTFGRKERGGKTVPEWIMAQGSEDRFPSDASMLLIFGAKVERLFYARSFWHQNDDLSPAPMTVRSPFDASYFTVFLFPSGANMASQCRTPSGDCLLSVWYAYMYKLHPWLLVFFGRKKVWLIHHDLWYSPLWRLIALSKS